MKLEKASIKILKLVVMNWTKFNKDIAVIPKIKGVIYTDDDNIWVQFKADDLYEEIYVLLVNKDLENQPEQFIEQILFHEFIHLLDSIELRKKYNLEQFKKLMLIYSEMHASEIQMDRMILTQKHKPYSLTQEVIHQGILTLESFLNQTLAYLEEAFILSEENKYICDFRKLYYFAGYLVSVKKHNINYPWSFSKLTSPLLEIFNEIITIFLENTYDNDVLLEYQTEVEETVISVTRKYLEDTLLNQILGTY